MDAWEDYVEWSGLDESALGAARPAGDASRFPRSDLSPADLSPAARTRRPRPDTGASRCRRAPFSALRRRTG